ncbi:hypothetical protein FB567DRAFT_104947 [Paraphoma chrysanthemicola]|uniref:UBZ4-type domain-containing protein n=1 Tax=Paraphoma chrysanthemicola TaxID=798071 RepID=A0A8K0R238_9PLEO|nr:hypothetical protein FB567DRAFT_104947 [Paraphoma chrysanthemicola]
MQHGRGRGNRLPRAPNNTRPPRARHPDHPSVPPFAAIRSGSAVSIILKQDQPTGHRVHGIVADLLTRGDHPRGVKVRLRDGRVGRVQALVSGAEGEQGEAVVGGANAGLGRDGEGIGTGSRSRGMRGGRIERDIRDEDEYLYDENRVPDRSQGLFAALEEADKRHQEQRGGGGKEEVEIVRCPVCGEFEGDERAVAHHVEEHFGG